MIFKKNEQVPVVQIEEKAITWSTKKAIICFLLFLISILCIIAGIMPLIEGFYELKSFANLVFVLFHGFFIFSFSAVKKNSQFFFWALSFMMLDAMTLIFIFYEEIFF